jgi:hypothetical protein
VSPKRVLATERLYVTRDDVKQRREKQRQDHRMKDDEKIKSLTFKPDRPGTKTKGMKDERKMFTEPKGVDQLNKRLAEGRKIRETKRQLQLRPNLN